MTSLKTSSALRAGALLFAIAAPPAFSQVRAAFPGSNRVGGPTPMQRSFPNPPAPRASTPMPQNSPGFVNQGNFGQQGGVVVGGSGLTVNGSYTGDNFNLAFHLGGGVPGHDGCFLPNGNFVCYPNYYYGYGWGYYNNYYDGYYDNSYQRYSVVDGALVQPILLAPAAPAPPPAEPPPPPTDAEVAATLLKAGDADGAADKYRLFLRDHADDAEAMRGLAVALLVAGEHDQGVAMMSMAYRTDPTLADRPLDDATLFRSDADLRKSVVKAVNFANKIKSASSWLSVGVLMQAEGRDDTALRMIARASDLGLDAALVKKFKVALGQ
jgi:hypothetical protein